MNLGPTSARPHFARIALCGVALVVFAGPALCADYPARKPGLWEMSVRSDGRGDAKTPPMTTQQCIDAATDQAMRDLGGGMSKDMCSKQDMRNDGGKMVVDSVCKIGTTTATTHAVMSGDFGSNYRMESRSTYSPPLMGQTEATAIIEAKWVGPCKAGQKPGDMMMPNGMKMNVLDMMKTKKP